MTTYAVNDRHLVAVWFDGETLRWENVTAVKGLAGVATLVGPLDAVSRLLWQRCEYLGERERLAAIVKSALRRNGSENPNRRRPKVNPPAWDKYTQRSLTEVLGDLGRALESMPDAVRAGVRSEILVELDAAYTCAAGGTDRQGRAGQMPVPAAQRLEITRLESALTTIVQRGETDRSLNEFTTSLLALLMVTTAVTSLQQHSGRSLAGDVLGRFVSANRGVAHDTLARAVDLVGAGNDATAVLRAAVGDTAALSAGLAGPVLHELLAKNRTGIGSPEDYRNFTECASVLLEQLLEQAPLPVPTTRRTTLPVDNDQSTLARARAQALGSRARQFTVRLGAPLRQTD
jgi:hypothetical protein